MVQRTRETNCTCTSSTHEIMSNYKSLNVVNYGICLYIEFFYKASLLYTYGWIRTLVLNKGMHRCCNWYFPTYFSGQSMVERFAFPTFPLCIVLQHTSILKSTGKTYQAWDFSRVLLTTSAVRLHHHRTLEKFNSHFQPALHAFFLQLCSIHACRR